MRKTVVFIVFLTVSLAAFGQVDSIKTLHLHKFDSLSNLADSRFKIDSLTVYAWGDSLKGKISLRFNADSSSYKNKIDSLQSLGLPTNKYSAKLDSVVQRRNALVSEVKSKQENLINLSKSRTEEWKEKVKTKLGISKLPDTPALPGVDIPDVNLPQTDLPKLPDANIPSMPGLDLPEMPALSAADFNGADLSPDLSGLNESMPFGKLDGLKDIQANLGDAGSALKDIGSLTKDTDKLIETGVDKIDGTGALKEKLGEGMPANDFTKTAEMMKDPAAMKEQVMEKAVNHFEGKEEVLQQAMEKISKYKQKYESINSLSEIKKRPPNPMKGKPFIERVVPGVALQLQQRNDLLLDINPYAGYRISGRLSSGLGWNQRIGYSLDNYYFTSMSVIYGPRLFTEFKVWKGFTVRAELEWMNTIVPPRFGGPVTDLHDREWVRSVMLGMKKDYRFLKHVKGTAFIMFNLFNPEHKSPYGDVVNTRFGFEFPLKKKPKKTVNQ